MYVKISQSQLNQIQSLLNEKNSRIEELETELATVVEDFVRFKNSNTYQVCELLRKDYSDVARKLNIQSAMTKRALDLLNETIRTGSPLQRADLSNILDIKV